jgi:MFS family permease
LRDAKSQARWTLGILFAINLLNFWDRFIFAAVAEPIRKEWLLSDSQIGWLATAFTLLYAVVGVPLGRLSDRWKRPTILGLGVAVWSLLTAFSGMAWNYTSLFAARLGVGVGEASCAPASNSLIGDLYPANQRGRAISLFMLGLPIGGFIGTFVSGQVAAAYGWRMAFYAACIPGLLLAILAFRITEPVRGSAEEPGLAEGQHDGSPYWRVLKIPTMRWIIASGALFNFNAYALITFLPAYFSRIHSLSLRDANTLTAIVHSGMGIPGMLLGGWAVDHMKNRQANGRLLVPALASLLTAPFLYLALRRPAGDLTGFVLLTAVSCLFTFMYYGGVYAAIQDVIPPRLRGTAMALYFMAMYLLGGSFGPVITGRTSDYFARIAMTNAGATSMTEVFRAAGLHSAMYIIPAGALVLSAVLFAASKTVGRDMHELRVWMTPGRKLSRAVESQG